MGAHPGPPLVVDLDGTLVATDTLVEGLAQLLRTAPGRVPTVMSRALLRGRAELKQVVVDASGGIDAAALPYRASVVDFVREARDAGRRVVLATAAHHSIAARVQAHLGLFDDVVASSATDNLKGARKLDAVRGLLGSDDFDYIGDSRADVPIWRATGRALVVAPSPEAAAQLADGVRVERVFVVPVRSRVEILLRRTLQRGREITE